MNKSRLKKNITTAALILSATIFSLPAFSQQSHGSETTAKGSSAEMGKMGGMMGGGHMGMMGGGHMGMMGGDHMGMMGDMMAGGHMGMMSEIKGLGLSDEQKQQMGDIQHKLRKRHWELMGPMIDQQAALKKAYAGDRPDPAAIGAVYGQIFDLKRQMIEARIVAKNSSMDVLTVEQAVKMKEMKKKKHQGGMMQGGMGE